MKETAYRVLFLEDEPTIREVLTEYMSMSGYQVTGVERGDAAIDLLRAASRCCGISRRTGRRRRPSC